MLAMTVGSAWAQTYNQRFDTDRDGKVSLSDVTYLVDYLLGKVTPYEYVDLDLPSGTLWATCNVGAESPEEYGDYFAWGETEKKSNYDWSTYAHCGGSSTTLTKYCTDSSYGTVDNLEELELSDDAAYVCWGHMWTMPSQEQFEELINSSYTTTSWTTQNGVNGRLITSNSNGNSIFLPAAGYYSESSLNYGGSFGYYWSRTLSSSGTSSAYILMFNSAVIITSGNGRLIGMPVRPVRTPGSISVTSITLSETSLSLYADFAEQEQWQLTATVLPANATNKSVKWESSNPAVATVSADGLVTAVGGGSCTITCTAMDGSGVSAYCSVEVYPDVEPEVSDEHEYVDLGLPSGTLWATCNVGADNPEDYGLYFAWGETEPYDENGKTTFNWSTYTLCNGSNTTMTKYCTSSNYGTVDNETELEPEDDAAYVNWGSNWRMPSYDQFSELINSNYTTTEWTTINGVNGRKITSRMSGYTDKYIFLPAAGYRDGASLYNAGSYGNYWSRALVASEPSDARYLVFASGGIGEDYDNRFYGQSVRPVRASQ